MVDNNTPSNCCDCKMTSLVSNMMVETTARM